MALLECKNVSLAYEGKTIVSGLDFKVEKGDYIFVPGVREAVVSGKESLDAYVINCGKTEKIELLLENLSAGEREILSDGCLINHYAK